MAQRLSEGNTIPHTPSGSAVTAGDVVVVGDLVGVAPSDIADGAAGALQIEGEFSFPKATGGGSGIAAGAVVYWDVAEAVAKTADEAGANKQIGYVTTAAADADATVRVKLDR